MFNSQDCWQAIDSFVLGAIRTHEQHKSRNLRIGTGRQAFARGRHEEIPKLSVRHEASQHSPIGKLRLGASPK